MVLPVLLEKVKLQIMFDSHSWFVFRVLAERFSDAGCQEFEHFEDFKDALVQRKNFENGQFTVQVDRPTEMGRRHQKEGRS